MSDKLQRAAAILPLDGPSVRGERYVQALECRYLHREALVPGGWGRWHAAEPYGFDAGAGRPLGRTAEMLLPFHSPLETIRRCLVLSCLLDVFLVWIC